jgi:hypothetical protein
MLSDLLKLKSLEMAETVSKDLLRTFQEMLLEYVKFACETSRNAISFGLRASIQISEKTKQSKKQKHMVTVKRKSIIIY